MSQFLTFNLTSRILRPLHSRSLRTVTLRARHLSSAIPTSRTTSITQFGFQSDLFRHGGQGQGQGHLDRPLFRFYSSSSGKDDDNDGSAAAANDQSEEIELEEGFRPDDVVSQSKLPATQIVPDTWPTVPVIAVNKHPVFPKFVKIVEVSDPKLMAILRRKVRLNQPYAGVFVKVCCLLF